MVKQPLGVGLRAQEATMTARCECGRFRGDGPCRFCHPFRVMIERVRFLLWRARMQRRVERRVGLLFGNGGSHRQEEGA